MLLDDFHFDLPPEQIARYPLSLRSASRLLCLAKESKAIVHRSFTDIIDLMEENDLLVMNNTKVIKARLFGQKTTGGKLQILVERVIDRKRILAQIRASKRLHQGDELILSKQFRLKVSNKNEPFYELTYAGDEFSMMEIIERLGHIPIPPYLKRNSVLDDEDRYQTIYALHKGSVAAPTAGLHFDELIMQKIRAKGVRIETLILHIGLGTFQPVRVESIKEHKMHKEYLSISQTLCDTINETKARGKRVIAVGTTTLRALEAVSQQGEMKAYSGDTDIFIYPGFSFRCVDALITNLHLPRSTLLMLVSAFGGYDNVMRAYKEAIHHRYRFYSYGDAMWIG